MIPETLRLRNYLSHRETEVDFKGLHLAVLIGPNGAGKSSLLDAITWAIWGRSRAAQDDALFHHGETFMEVEIVFRLPLRHQNERRYRILRRRESKGRRSSQTLLDFQVEGENGWRSLNGSSVRETQKHINTELRLDYETFINSAYLRQGRADEFLALDPADRKRVLGTILNLESWETYREAARDRLSEVKARSEELAERLKAWELDLQRRPQLQRDLEQAQRDQEQARAQMQKVMDRLKGLEEVRQKARELELQQHQQQRQCTEFEIQLKRLGDQEIQQQERRRYCLTLIAQAEAIEAEYAAYQAALEEERAWTERLSQAAQLKEAVRAYEQALAQERETLQKRLLAQKERSRTLEKRAEQARTQLEKELSELEGQERVLRSRMQEQTLLISLQEAEAQLQELEALQQRFEQARTDLQALREEKTRLETDNKQLKAAMDEKKQQLELLTGHATCPLCRQPLSEAHRAELDAIITAEGKALGDTYRANRERLQQIAATLRDLQAFLDETEPKLRRLSALNQHVARLREQVEQMERDRVKQASLLEAIAQLRQRLANADYAKAEQQELQTVQQACTELQTRLEREDYGQAAREALAALASQLQALGYDAKAHEAVRQRVAALKGAEARLRELDKARVEITSIEGTLTRLAQEKAQWQDKIAELKKAMQAGEAERAALQPLLDELPRLETALAQARQQESDCRDEVRRLNQELAALATTEKRLKEGYAEQQTLKTRQVILSELQEAFSVRGIPALIIERALPELERETNTLLEHLTHGQMNVQFRTQKETRSGELRETLDLLISDTRGTRPYDLFSGGEQFRINFAVRVALSRLLAQRAGVRLRTLFIDEGFGVLDTDGRERLIEAIRAIQQDFDLLLVITHIEELQDAFPTRILVTRDGGSSQVQVL